MQDGLERLFIEWVSGIGFGQPPHADEAEVMLAEVQLCHIVPGVQTDVPLEDAALVMAGCSRLERAAGEELLPSEVPQLLKPHSAKERHQGQALPQARKPGSR